MDDILKELFIIAILSTAVIYACYKIKIPTIVGFLITGAVCGPSALSLVDDIEVVNTLADVGVVFLLFTIGMEISISELIRLKKPVFLGGTLQVFFTIGFFWWITEWVWHDTTGADIFIGFLMALSSTAIVLNQLQKNAMGESPSGRIALSMLIYQDLIVVPMMLAMPFLAGKASGDNLNFLQVAETGVKTIVIVVGMFLLARKVVPWALRLIIKTKSRELFLISVIGICLGTAFFTNLLGLSVSLGAFIAGLIVAESEYSHSALEGILPFKDIFTSIFFISVGMLLNMQFFLTNIVEVLAVTFLILFMKAFIILLVTKIMRYPLRTAIMTGMFLCQVGEFSFVLAKSGFQMGLLNESHYQLFLASSILTMLATPFFIDLAPAFSKYIDSFFKKNDVDHVGSEETKDAPYKDHIIILGFGVAGKIIARAAKVTSIPYVILEMNPDTVKKYATQGEPIIYGDAIHPAVLTALGIENARVLALVISDPAAVRGITEIARHMNHTLQIIVRTRFLGEVESLKKLGANEVVPEEFETSIEVFTRVLAKYLVPRNEIEKITNDIREENVEMLREINLQGSQLHDLQNQIPELKATAFTLEKDAPLDGKTIGESALRQKAHITVVAVKRSNEIFSNTGAEFKLLAGDIVYIFSTAKNATLATPLFEGVGAEAGQ